MTWLRGSLLGGMGLRRGRRHGLSAPQVATVCWCASPQAAKFRRVTGWQADDEHSTHRVQHGKVWKLTYGDPTLPQGALTAS